MKVFIKTVVLVVMCAVFSMSAMDSSVQKRVPTDSRIFTDLLQELYEHVDQAFKKGLRDKNKELGDAFYNYFFLKNNTNKEDHREKSNERLHKVFDSLFSFSYALKHEIRVDDESIKAMVYALFDMFSDDEMVSLLYRAISAFEDLIHPNNNKERLSDPFHFCDLCDYLEEHGIELDDEAKLLNTKKINALFSSKDACYGLLDSQDEFLNGMALFLRRLKPYVCADNLQDSTKNKINTILRFYNNNQFSRR